MMIFNEIKKNEEEKITINLFGIGCKMVKSTIDEPLLNKINECAKILKSSFSYAVFDSDFYKLLNLPDYKSWGNFNNLFQIKGLLNHPKSMIEIRKKRKQILRINFNELLNKELLFSLYNINKKNITQQPMCIEATVIEEEIGKVATFHIKSDNFNIDDLIFVITEVKMGEQPPFSLLTEIKYMGVKLNSKNSDTLISLQSAYLTNNS